MAQEEKKISEQMDKAKKMDVYFKSFIAGGVAGMCGKTTVAPLDRLRILLLAQNRHYKQFGVCSGVKAIVEKEGFTGLYKGNGAQLVRVFPFAALKFGSFEVYKMILRHNFGLSHDSSNFLSGSAAGVTASIVTYPLDIVRARLAFQVAGEHRYSGICDTLSCIRKTEGGIRALYKGLTPSILGMIPYAGLQFYLFEKFKSMSFEHMSKWNGQTPYSTNKDFGLVVTVHLLSGGLAGAIARTVTYPLSVARRKMQLSMMRPDMHRFGKNLIKTLVITFREDGIVRGLYRGMSINYIRAIPMGAVTFATYGLAKRIFRFRW